MKKNPFMRFILPVIALALANGLSCSPAGDSGAPSYIIEDIPMPRGLKAGTGGISFFPDGRLVACFIRGEVMVYSPETREWTVFAEGLHEPLGIMAVNDHEVLVMQRPELTRLVDTDGDGQADLYEKVTADFGLSGNYHEFNFGPVKDADGNLFIALNAASSGGKIRPKVRGDLNLDGRDGETGMKQMYSVVPYRGWVMKLTPDGELLPFASGFRSPNGLGISPEGDLFVTDNQSDWVETNTLYHVQKGNFYGHPASLVWDEDWDKGSPFDLPISELKALRTEAAILFPHGIMANSPSEPAWDTTKGKFGPFEGQLFVGEMNNPRLVRVMLEKVGGQFQGACIPFFNNQLPIGNNRLAFAPDGSLWVGKIIHGNWAGADGIQRIVYTGVPPMDVYSMNLTKDGFDITFTQPVDNAVALEPNNYRLQHYFYEYRKKPFDEPTDKTIQQDLQEVPVADISLSRNGKTVSIKLDGLKPGYVYELSLENIESRRGRPLENTLVCYTLNRLLD